jgi:hypothetical protein
MLKIDLPAPCGRFARVRADLVAQHPSLGPEWHAVLEFNPSALTPSGGPDRVWLVVHGRPRLLPANILELSQPSRGRGRSNS